MTFEPLENYNINDFSIMSDEDIVALANSGHTLAQESVSYTHLAGQDQ